MSKEQLLDCAFQGTFDNVSVLLDQLKTEMDQRAVDASCKGDVLIVLGEVLNNIVEHAYSSKGGGYIYLKAHANKEAVFVTTIDHGPPMPPSTLSHASLPKQSEDVQGLPEGGFGWFMIHTLTDDMSYERVDGENRLSFSVAC